MLLGPVSLDQQGIRGLWGRLTPTQRISLAGVVGLMVIVLGVFANAARSPEYLPAFTGMKDDEAAAVVARLKDSKIPYELGDGNTIKVPAAQVQEVRLLMASQGIGTRNSNNTGYELFSQPHIGMTEFAEKINYQRALEGELSRTINRLDAVDSSRVHVVVPQPSLFSTQQKETTASVVLQLKSGRRLDAGQVQGITQLVASSVEGLKTNNVTVMDASGVVLGESADRNDPSRLTGTRRDVQRAIESRLEEDVRTMLGRVVGADKVIVRVNTELNWDQYEATSETYSPDQKTPQIRSQRQVAEVQGGGAAGANAGGVPGTASNVPTYANNQNSTAGSANQRQETETNYELSKTIEKLSRAPGGIKRISVAVALDSEAIAEPAQADAISKLVVAAAGIDTNRGDAVTLTSLPFTALGQGKGAGDLEATRQREFVLSIARLAAMVLGPLFVVALVWLVMRRGQKRPVNPNAVTISVEDPKHPMPALAAQQLKQLPEVKPEDAEAIRLQTELVKLARKEPAAMAQIVRAWMAEEKAPA